mgnify:CR=1 FL=1
MFDEKDTTRHIHRGARKDPDRTVEVDSSAFFAPETGKEHHCNGCSGTR